MDLDRIGPVLMVVGLVIVATGAILWMASGLGLGRLPGDIAWRRGNVRVYVPLMSSLIVSVVLTVVLTAILRR